MTERIGFVGVGRMGANMARRLKECGYEITAVYDILGELDKSGIAELTFKGRRTSPPQPGHRETSDH